MKEKCEASTRRFAEAVQVHNNISDKYNELKSFVDLMKSENARLSKNLKAAEVALFAKEAKLKQVEFNAKYYEDKSTSINLFTIVKVHADMLKEYSEGKISSRDPEAAFAA